MVIAAGIYNYYSASKGSKEWQLTT